MAAPVQRAVVVRFTVEGFHCWPEAPVHRAYLAERHRHLFHVEAQVAVEHNDREVEFHDLLEQCRQQLPPGEQGTASCEVLAERLLSWLGQHYPGRQARVSVFEDGECGAVLETRP